MNLRVKVLRQSHHKKLLYPFYQEKVSLKVLFQSYCKSKFILSSSEKEKKIVNNFLPNSDVEILIQLSKSKIIIRFCVKDCKKTIILEEV